MSCGRLRPMLWCLKNPTRFSPSKPPYSILFLVVCRIPSYPFRLPFVKGPNLGHFLVRVTAFILGADARNRGLSLHCSPSPRRKNRELMTPFFGFTLVPRFGPVGRFMYDEMGGACIGCNRLVSSRNAVIPVMVSLHRDLGHSRLRGAALQGPVTFSLFNTIKLWYPSDLRFHQLTAVSFISTLLFHLAFSLRNRQLSP
jgi:hypothetical protein